MSLAWADKKKRKRKKKGTAALKATSRVCWLATTPTWRCGRLGCSRPLCVAASPNSAPRTSPTALELSPGTLKPHSSSGSSSKSSSGSRSNNKPPRLIIISSHNANAPQSRHRRHRRHTYSCCYHSSLGRLWRRRRRRRWPLGALALFIHRQQRQKSRFHSLSKTTRLSVPPPRQPTSSSLTPFPLPPLPPLLRLTLLAGSFTLRCARGSRHI
mmetsp:Transcript_26180/g.53635  ORF Transcript_26180/g.53635 Transcript_26180/m.53635 type:complete len:213 (+) Transcript_26180:336-974(+)